MTRRIRYRRRRSLGTYVKRILLVVIIAAPVLFFGSKFWIEYEIENALSRLKSDMAAVGELRHRNVSVWFDGSITIAGLSFYPNQGVRIDPFLSDSARTEFADYLDLLKAARERVPRQLSIEFRGVRGGPSSDSVSGIPTEALACSDGQSFSPLELSEMGVGDTLANLYFGYAMDPSHERVDIEVRQEIVGQSESIMRMGIEVPGLAQFRGQIPVAPDLRLTDASLTMRAEPFMLARNNYCGQRHGVAPKRAALDNANAMIASMAPSGWLPNENLRQQYQRFMETGEQWTISVRPIPPVELTDLAQLPPDRILARLAPSGEIGAFTDARLGIVSARSQDTGTSADNLDVAPPPTRLWEPVAIADLVVDSEQLMRIETLEKQYIGYIVALDPATVEALVSVEGGQARLPILKERISRVLRYLGDD